MMTQALCSRSRLAPLTARQLLLRPVYDHYTTKALQNIRKDLTTAHIKRSFAFYSGKSSDIVIPCIKNEEALESIGNRLAPFLRRGDVVLLTGDLGAGKSTFTRGVVRNLCNDFNMIVTSPTYLLDNVYTVQYDQEDSPTSKTTDSILQIHHMDLYRLTSSDIDFSFLSIPQVFSDSICLIEWPERLGNLIPENHLMINIVISPNSEARKVTVNASGGSWMERIDRISNALL